MVQAFQVLSDIDFSSDKDAYFCIIRRLRTVIISDITKTEMKNTAAQMPSTSNNVGDMFMAVDLHVCLRDLRDGSWPEYVAGCARPYISATPQ